MKGICNLILTRHTHEDLTTGSGTAYCEAKATMDAVFPDTLKYMIEGYKKYYKRDGYVAKNEHMRGKTMTYSVSFQKGNDEKELFLSLKEDAWELNNDIEYFAIIASTDDDLYVLEVVANEDFAKEMAEEYRNQLPPTSDTSIFYTDINLDCLDD